MPKFIGYDAQGSDDESTYKAIYEVGGRLVRISRLDHEAGNPRRAVLKSIGFTNEQITELSDAFQTINQFDEAESITTQAQALAVLGATVTAVKAFKLLFEELLF